MTERSYDQRRHCWEWEEQERQEALRAWEVDNLLTLAKDNKPNKADVTYTHKQA